MRVVSRLRSKETSARGTRALRHVCGALKRRNGSENNRMKFTPCGCGCGRLVRGAHAPGHRPVVRSYRIRGGIRMHRRRAEQALGKPLPPKAVVHHADGTRSDDAPLVICENQSYHRLLHARMNVKRAGGHPDSDAVCGRCRTVKPRGAFARDRANGVTGLYRWCRACKNEARRSALTKAGAK